MVIGNLARRSIPPTIPTTTRTLPTITNRPTNVIQFSSSNNNNKKAEQKTEKKTERKSPSSSTSSTDHKEGSKCSVCQQKMTVYGLKCSKCMSTRHLKCNSGRDVEKKYRRQWICDDCAVCEICKRRETKKRLVGGVGVMIQSEKMGQCKKCQSWYHVGCLGGEVALKCEREPNCKWTCNKCLESSQRKRKRKSSGDVLSLVMSNKSSSKKTKLLLTPSATTTTTSNVASATANEGSAHMASSSCSMSSSSEVSHDGSQASSGATATKEVRFMQMNSPSPTPSSPSLIVLSPLSPSSTQSGSSGSEDSPDKERHSNASRHSLFDRESSSCFTPLRTSSQQSSIEMDNDLRFSLNDSRCEIDLNLPSPPMSPVMPNPPPPPIVYQQVIYMLKYKYGVRRYNVRSCDLFSVARTLAGKQNIQLFSVEYIEEMKKEIVLKLDENLNEILRCHSSGIIIVYIDPPNIDELTAQI